MRRRYVIVPDVPDEMDSPLIPGHGLLQETVATAVIVFCGLVLAELGFGISFMSLGKAVGFAIKLLGLDLGVAALFAVVLAVYRTLRHEREERLRLEEIYRRWEREDWEWEKLTAVEEEDVERAQAELAEADVDYIARQILKRYYATLEATGDPAKAVSAISRRACVKAGICNQPQWNLVNHLLQVRGIRDGRYLKPRTFAEAWGMWVEGRAKTRRWGVNSRGEWVPLE